MTMDMPPDPFTEQETQLAVNIALLESFTTAPARPPANPGGMSASDTIRAALDRLWGAPVARPVPRFVLYVAAGTGVAWAAAIAGAGLAEHYEVRESPWVSTETGVVVDRWWP